MIAISQSPKKHFYCNRKYDIFHLYFIYYLRETVMKKFIKAIIILSAFTLLSACGENEVEMQVEKSAEVLYQEATVLAGSGASSTDVFNAYEEVERQHPQSAYAKKAIADLVEFAYDNLRYKKAISAAKDYLENNPSQANTSKIHYILALSYYEQIVDRRREQSNTARALETLNDIIILYPNSDYAIDAKSKIDLTIDHLAAKELSVGRFYQRSQNYQAALVRFSTVVKNYSKTSQVPEALARLAETYLALGLYDQAYKTASVLGYNHPNNTWYKYTYGLVNSYKK